MTDPSVPESNQPDIPPPPPGRNPWKIAAVVLGVVIAGFIVLVIIGSRVSDNRDEKLAEALPASIETNFRNKGIDVSVTSVSCEDLPTTDATFSIQCEVRIDEVDEVVEATVQGSVNDDLVQIDEVFSKERLLTPAKAVEYVQNLVEQQAQGVTVLECDLGGDVAVIRTGSEFTCTLDSNETVLISVAADGSGSITDVFDTGGA